MAGNKGSGRNKGHLKSWKRFIPLEDGAVPRLPPPLVMPAASKSSVELKVEKRKEKFNKWTDAAETKAQWRTPEQLGTKILTSIEIRARIMRMMNDHSYDPLRELIKIANNPTTDMKMRVMIHQELAQYIAPKLRATDLQVSGDLNISISVMKFSGANGDRLAANRESIPVRATEVGPGQTEPAVESVDPATKDVAEAPEIHAPLSETSKEPSESPGLPEDEGLGEELGDSDG